MESPKCYRRPRVIDKSASRYVIYGEALFLSYEIRLILRFFLSLRIAINNITDVIINSSRL